MRSGCANRKASQIRKACQFGKALQFGKAWQFECLSRAADFPVPLLSGAAPIKPMTPRIPALADFRRIVVKVGSSLLIDAAAGRVKQAWLASLVVDIARLHGERRDLLVVSSGA